MKTVETIKIPEIYSFIHKGDIEKIKEFISDSNFDVNKIHSDSITPLSYACLFGDIEVIDLLLNHGADVNFRNSFGSTPLLESIYYDNLEVFELLLKHGANVEIKNRSKESPLILSTKFNNSIMFDSIVSLLKDFNNIDDRDRFGFSPLMYSAKNGNSYIGENLIKMGASVNSSNLKGDTILNIAVQDERVEFTKMLCKYDPIHSKGSNGFYPKDYAVKIRNLKLLASLNQSWLGQI